MEKNERQAPPPVQPQEDEPEDWIARITRPERLVAAFVPWGILGILWDFGDSNEKFFGFLLAAFASALVAEIVERGAISAIVLNSAVVLGSVIFIHPFGHGSGDAGIGSFIENGMLLTAIAAAMAGAICGRLWRVSGGEKFSEPWKVRRK